ncbi:MAG: hypothetical protein JWR59_1588, partial [Brevundimonas sp.]|nr:hypothetical protein [Brevundimonas sp.]
PTRSITTRPRAGSVPAITLDVLVLSAQPGPKKQADSKAHATALAFIHAASRCVRSLCAPSKQEYAGTAQVPLAEPWRQGPVAPG